MFVTFSKKDKISKDIFKRKIIAEFEFLNKQKLIDRYGWLENKNNVVLVKSVHCSKSE